MRKEHVGGAQGGMGASSGPAGLVGFAGHLRLEAPEKGPDSDQGASRGGSLLGEWQRNPCGQALAPGCFIGATRALFPEAVALAPPSLGVKCPAVRARVSVRSPGSLQLRPQGSGE